MGAGNIHLVQLKHSSGRYIALVNEPELRLIDRFDSIYELALAAINSGEPIETVIQNNLTKNALDYNEVYAGTGDWQLLPSFDVPGNQLACMVSGTGLTHKNSALNRQMMHKAAEDKPTDSMVMYQWGVEGGNPEKGKIGVQPEWFYKGNGSILKAHGESLEVPVFGNDGGEEPELAAVYVISEQGIPYRIGFTTGNEFSDHIMEKKNYLYLAPSKLRECAIGPELVIDADFSALTGEVSVSRDDVPLWSSAIKTGEENMAHNLANLEYHHFKYAAHRIPLQAHVHFFGADAFSFGSQVRLQEGDEMQIKWDGMGRALKNYLRTTPGEEQSIEIRSI